MGGPDARHVADRPRARASWSAISRKGRARQGRTVTHEGHPERGLFYRADHFTLARRGVPVLLSMALAGRL